MYPVLKDARMPTLALLVPLSLFLIVGIPVLSPPPVLAEHGRADVELRGGAGIVCGACRDRDISPWYVKPTVQLFADVLFPVLPIGPGALVLGPYAKGALLDGPEVPQIAGGVVVGYHVSRWEFLVNGGLAYATERIGMAESQDYRHEGQTKHTYDLGIWVRYHLDRYFVSAGYTHNSNGTGVGLNYAQGKGFNPGYDQLFLGVGIRF